MMAKNGQKLTPQGSTWLLQDRSGFTLIEVLMAVILVAVLATLALTQFNDFTADSKNSAVKGSLRVLREGIQKQYGQMRMRCSIADPTLFPTLAQVQGNDVTIVGPPTCTNVQVTGENKKFVAGGIPANPWSDTLCSEAQKRSITAVAVAGTIVVGTAVAPVAVGGNACGWLYDATTGGVAANTANNGGTPTENAY